MTGGHLHEEQEELYFLHRGRIAIEFGDGQDGYVGRDGKLPPGEESRSRRPSS